MTSYNFTERVRTVLAWAREEAIRLGHEYVGTEHMLLGLLRDEGGVAVAALDALRVDRGRVRRLVEETVRPGTAPPLAAGELPYTSRAKKALELAMDAARTLGHAYVGTEHILIGLIAEEKGIAGQVLIHCGAAHDAVVAQTVLLLGSPASGGQATSPYARAPEGRPAPSPEDVARESMAWARLHHALDATAKLGAPPSVTLADDGSLDVSLGAELVVRVTFPPHVEIRRRA